MTAVLDVDSPDYVPKHAAPASPTSRVARNFGMLMTSQMVTWTLSILGAVIIPRYLGAELLSRLHLTNSLWAIGFILASFGMNLLVAKEVARTPDRIGELLGTSLALRALLFIPTTLLLLGFGVLVGYPDGTMVLLLIGAAVGFLRTISAGIAAVLQGVERMGAISMASIVERVVFVGGAIALLVAGYSVYAVALVMAVGASISLVLQTAALKKLRRGGELGTGLRVSAPSMRRMFVASAPYFGTGFFIVLYQQVDAVVISLVVETEEVLGWYSVYDQLAGTLLFMPAVFMTAVYPALSRLYAERSSLHGTMTQKSFELMLLISVPVGLGLATIARPLVQLLYGSEFTNAAPVLAVGGIVTSLTYLNTVFGMFLISMDRQAAWTRVIAIAVVLSIPLDFALVPFFQSQFDNGAIGGAVAYLITESVMLVGAIVLLPAGSLAKSSLGYACRVVLAGLVMVAVVWPLRNQIIVIPIAAGALVYTALLLPLRVIAPEDRELIAGRLRPVLSRMRRQS